MAFTLWEYEVAHGLGNLNITGCNGVVVGSSRRYGMLLDSGLFWLWVAVKELELRDYPPIMENQMEKNMENEMETRGIFFFKEGNFSRSTTLGAS